ncbi:hypothetical protein GE061_007645 [Apolygus lucorum]|uniref:Uncharacterized protein n=1 Tax=Apolygus lucorum TaxID=248454 RepID=A0A6A4ITR2_APOLU|nr:hypothetical protein GE061_007645 [Apolygus lucorum]
MSRRALIALSCVLLARGLPDVPARDVSLDVLGPIVRSAHSVLSGRVSGRPSRLVVSPIRTFKGAPARAFDVVGQHGVGGKFGAGDTRIFFLDKRNKIIHEPLRPNLRILNIVDALVRGKGRFRRFPSP